MVIFTTSESPILHGILRASAARAPRGSACGGAAAAVNQCASPWAPGEYDG